MLTAPANPSNAASRRRFARAAAAAVAAALLAGCNAAADPNHPLRGPASAIGWATTPGEPKDFVKASRGRTELAYIPVGRGGVERAVAVRTPDGARALEAELDRQRDQVTGYARRPLPAGAYGQPLPSVAAPPAASGSSPESYPVNPNRLRRIRENARQAGDS